MAVKYYNTENIVVFPTSNSVDNGKLTLEENMSAIVTRITTRNYVLSDTDLVVTISGNTLVIGEGNCNIAGFDVRTNASMILEAPDSNPFEGYLAMKLTFDGSGHVRGDEEDGRTVIYAGLYVSYITADEIDEYTLVLGSVSWDGSTLEFIRNPDIEHRLDASDISATVDIRTFDLNGDGEGTATTMNLQEYVLNIPDWYVSKFGDFMIGNLEFDTGTYTYDNDSNKGVYSNRVNCGHISISNATANRGVEFVSLSPADSENIKVVMAAEKDLFSGTKYYSGLGNEARVGSSIGGRGEFEINNTSNGSTGYINFTDNNAIDIHGHNDVTISGYSNSGNTGNIELKILNGDMTISTLDSSSPKHLFSFNKGGDNKYYPAITIDQLRMHTGLDGFTVIENRSNKPVRINPSIITDSYIRVGSTNNYYAVLGIDSSSSSLNQYVNSERVSFTTNGYFYTTKSIASTASLEDGVSLKDSYNYVKIGQYDDGNNDRDGAFVIINSIAGNTPARVTFQHNGNSVTLSNSGNSVLNLTGNFNATGTITGSKVYNAVYNDYAEWFEKDNIEEEFNPGDVIELNPITGKYRKSTGYMSKFVVGVYSDTYGHIVGGEKLSNMEDNIEKYIPVGLAGRVYVKVTNNTITPGDLLSSAPNGYAVRSNRQYGTVIGKALSGVENGKVFMLIMLG